jgi:amidase
MRTLLAAPVAEQRAALDRGDVSARELVALHLEQIARVNPRLNAVVALDAEAALAAAERLDRARTRGGAPGPLHGVPMTIKDGIDTRGLVTTGGTLGRRDWIPGRDATAVARLRRAGAVLLGKTNTPELTLYYDTDNLVHGRTHNPYDTARSPGGSSGGAAAIVAACGAAFDLGSDTGGSVRLPAHFCGLAGLKPTSGRVSCAGFVIPPGSPVSDLTQIGPLARRVADLFPILRAIAGPDDGDSRVAPVPLRDPARVRRERLRIGWYADSGIVPVTPAVRGVVEHAATRLAEVCARVEPALPPGLEETAAAYSQLFGIDGGAWVRRLLEAYGTARPFPRLRWAQGLPDEPASALTALHAAIEARRAALLAFMARYDALLCPVHTDAALPADALMDPARRVAFTYTQVYNLAGWPAGVVRAGSSDEGLPIGVQVVARPWREDIVLAVLEAIETTCGGWRAPALAGISGGGGHDG